MSYSLFVFFDISLFDTSSSPGLPTLTNSISSKSNLSYFLIFNFHQHARIILCLFRCKFLRNGSKIFVPFVWKRHPVLIFHRKETLNDFSNWLNWYDWWYMYIILQNENLIKCSLINGLLLERQDNRGMMERGILITHWIYMMALICSWPSQSIILFCFSGSWISSLNGRNVLMWENYLLQFCEGLMSFSVWEDSWQICPWPLNLKIAFCQSFLT